MKKSRFTSSHLIAGLVALTATVSVRADMLSTPSESELRDIYDDSARYTDAVEFPNRTVGGDVDSGRRNFGLSADGNSIDTSQGLFQGFSLLAGNVVGNGRACSSCHRPGGLDLGLPNGRLSDSVPLSDPLFTGLVADTGDEPQGFTNFNELGLLFHSPGRFNPTFPADSPFRKVFVWRRTTRLLNTVFTFGVLNEGRLRELTEATRGAVFTHTQNGDIRFDDITNVNNQQRLRDIAAFIEDQIEPPELRALLDPTDPMYARLVADPFLTVPVHTDQERLGQQVFERNCMSCHNMPNVFGNRDHGRGTPLSLPPLYGHSYDIGVAQRNFHHLEFRRFDAATNTRVPIVLPLAREDGTTVNVTVVDDPGAAAATGRYEDLHRFKVPQLRRVARLGPYFHDNSAATLEEVVDYFLSDWYRNSVDGSRHPININGEERAALLAFLRIL